MVRGFVPEHIWVVLVELSYFFRQLYAKELSRKVVADLEKRAPELVYKMEKIFPPGFFLSMQHLIVHLPYEARMGGPCRPAGAIQSRDIYRHFARNVEIKPELRLPSQRRSLTRR
jgi:hypothetical protein